MLTKTKFLFLENRYLTVTESVELTVNLHGTYFAAYHKHQGKKMENVNKSSTLIELQKRLIYQVRKLIFGLSIESPVEDLEKVRDEIKSLSEQLQKRNNEELGAV